MLADPKNHALEPKIRTLW